MKELTIKNCERRAIVDDEDYDKLIKYNWYSWYGVRRIHRNYCICSKTFSKGLANEILSISRKIIIDHIDRDPFNNQKSNLREVTVQQNSMNVAKYIRKDTTSKYKGVGWHKSRSKWRAVIMVDGHQIYLGLHRTEEDAARAYDKKAHEIYGDIACLNFSAK